MDGSLWYASRTAVREDCTSKDDDKQSRPHVAFSYPGASHAIATHTSTFQFQGRDPCLEYHRALMETRERMTIS